MFRIESMAKEQKVIYYSDELHEDFANNGVKAKKVSENYKYLSKNPFSRFFSIVILV